MKIKKKKTLDRNKHIIFSLVLRIRYFESFIPAVFFGALIKILNN